MSNSVIPFTARTGVYRSEGVTARGGTDRAVYTVKEVADLLSLSLGSTYALLRAGDIPALKLGSRWVVPKTRFHAWLDDCVLLANEPVPGGSFGNRRGSV